MAADELRFADLDPEDRDPPAEPRPAAAPPTAEAHARPTDELTDPLLRDRVSGVVGTAAQTHPMDQ